MVISRPNSITGDSRAKTAKKSIWKASRETPTTVQARRNFQNKCIINIFYNNNNNRPDNNNDVNNN